MGRRRNQAGIRRTGTPRRSTTPRSPGNRRLLRRGDANRDQRRVGGACRGTAGRASFGQKLRRISGRPTIGGDQNFVFVTLDGTGARYAVVADHPHARAGSALLTLRPRWAGRSRRTDRTHRTGVSFGPLRSRGAGIALGTLPAG